MLSGAATARSLVTQTAGRAYREALALDRLLDEKVRLGIVTAIAARGSLSFKELRQILGTSDGNVSVHARKLEQAGYVECTKTFENRVPRTEYALTSAGREALTGYVEHLERLAQLIRAL